MLKPQEYLTLEEDGGFRWASPSSLFVSAVQRAVGRASPTEGADVAA
jgi:hypothetical protein